MNRKIYILLSLLFLGTYFTAQAQAPITGPNHLCQGTLIALSSADAGGTWTSSNTSVATIEIATGVVHALNPASGVTVITYGSSAGTVTTSINVYAPPLPISGPTPNTLCVGSSITLTESGPGAPGGTWSSDLTSLATVSPAGGVTGVSPGTVTISYMTECGYVQSALIVTELTQSITGTSNTVCAGTGIQLSDPTAGGTWTSSNNAIATVDGVGAVGTNTVSGNVVISYTNGCGIQTYSLTVNPAPNPIGGLTTFCLGSLAALTNSTIGGTWSSGSTTIATIDQGNGQLTASGVGSSVIRYTLTNGCFASYAIVVSNCPACPLNSDFELDNYTVWHYYSGTCCPISTPTTCNVPPNGPGTCNIPNRFALTGPVGAPAPVVITGVDPFGGFPVVGAGIYSLRIGTCQTQYFAEKATYFVHVPNFVGTYALIYRYAVVLQDPNHTPATQPRFTALAYDSATNAPIPCNPNPYVAGSLPGFVSTNVTGLPFCGGTSTFGPNSNNATVFYKPWATTSINLSGLGGHTIRMEFSAGDCGQGGHFGYGYVDMTCGTFAIATLGCGDTIATVTAPAGFANYAWYDSLTFTTLYGTTQTVTFPMPTVPTTYAVIMTPYVGFGCPDTLYTRIRPSNLQTNPKPDTLICVGQSATISSGATDIALPLSYSWTPLAGLSCSTCANPVVTPLAGVNVYTAVVTDDAGCSTTITQRVRVDSVAGGTGGGVITTPTSCFSFADGTAKIVPTAGIAPFTYSWSTVPAQTTSLITGLPVGSYTANITDSAGCHASATGTVTQPPVLSMSIGGTVNPDSCGGQGGSITINGLVPSTPFTIRYLYTATNTTTTVVGTFSGGTTNTGSLMITGLHEGSYDSIAVVTTGCPYNTLGPIVLSDPPPPALPFVSSNSPVCELGPLNLQTNDITPNVTYLWSGPAGFGSTIQQPVITSATIANSGWYIVTVDHNNCFSTDSTLVVVRPNPIPSIDPIDITCSGTDTVKLHGHSDIGPDGYIWNGPNGFTSNFQNPIIPNATMAAAGIYTLTVVYQGCYGSDTEIATINLTPDPPIVTPVNYCQGDAAVPLTATGTNLLWYTDSLGGSPLPVAPTPDATIPGTYIWYVTQTSNDSHQCTSLRAPAPVGVYELPHPVFFMADSVYCAGTFFTFGVTGQNTGVDYQGLTWSFGSNDSVYNTNPVVHTFNTDGSTVVSVNVYYNVCPDATLSHNVTVFGFPGFTLGGDTSICPGSDPITLGASGDVDYTGVSWLWNTGETTQNIHVGAPGVYYVKGTIAGCNTSDTITVLNDCYMNLPNVFSPNGDGVNDYFYPRQLLTKGLTAFTMNIYNRWGQQVFTTTSLDGRGWDGKFNDVAQPEGVFIYIIDATFKDGQKEHHQGNVTLLR